jgi:hypothetical protein
MYFFFLKIFPFLSFPLCHNYKPWSSSKIAEHFKYQQTTNTSVFKEGNKGKSQFHASLSTEALAF